MSAQHALVAQYALIVALIVVPLVTLRLLLRYAQRQATQANPNQKYLLMYDWTTGQHISKGRAVTAEEFREYLTHWCDVYEVSLPIYHAELTEKKLSYYPVLA